MLFLFLFILLLPAIRGLGSCSTENRVKPDIQFSDYTNNGSAALQNTSLVLNTHSSFAILRVLCSAPYPIQLTWNFTGIQNQSQFDGKARRLKENARRGVGNFWDANTYVFELELFLWFEHPEVEETFTCAAIEEPCLQSVLKSSPRGSLVTITVSNRNIRTTPQPNDDSIATTTNCDATLYYAPHLPNYKYRCELRDGSKADLRWKWGLWCVSKVISCKSLSIGIQLSNGGSQSENCVKLSELSFMGNGSGIPRLEREGFETMLASCGNVPMSTQFYFGVEGKAGSIRPIYVVDGLDAQRTGKQGDLIYIKEWVEDDYFENDTLTVICRMSAYVGAIPFQIGFGYNNRNEIEIISSGTEESYDEYEWDVWSNTKTGKMEVELNSPFINRVICFGPLQETEGWINASREITIKEFKNLTFTTPTGNAMVDEYYFELGQVNASISCDAYGVPGPTLITLKREDLELVNGSGVWISTYYVNSTRTDHMRSTITFDEVNYKHSGVYTCVAKEYKKFDHMITTNIHVNVIDYVTRRTTIIASVGAAVVILLLFLVLGLFWRKMRLQRAAIRKLTPEEVRGFIEGDSNALSTDAHAPIHALPFNTAYEISKDYLTIDESRVLGAGAFGYVTKGSILMDGVPTTVAIKRCRPNVDVTYFKALLAEAKIMAHIGKHQNIVSLVGAVTADIQDRMLCLAVEFCRNGDLSQRLRRGKNNFLNMVRGDEVVEESSVTYQNNLNEVNLSTLYLLRWARDIASGMDFLASKKVLHGDLATRNVLLTKKDVAKISDFGLSRDLVYSALYVKTQQMPLPWKWMSIEALKYSTFSVHSDVWAYGVTLWEIFSLGENPYPGLNWNLGFLAKLEAGFRMARPTYATSNIFDLMKECWDPIPENRPTFASLMEYFEDVISQLDLMD